MRLSATITSPEEHTQETADARHATMPRLPTRDEIIEHSHPETGGGGYWIAMVGVHRTPVVVRLWSAGEWHYVDGSDEDATWVPGELLGSSSGYASARPAAEVIDGLYAEAWWRWDANGPTRLL